MSADRSDSARGADGLLYIPDDDLVRTTVDGDDAGWSDARSYVPSDALIRSVLGASSRERPRFKFPDWYAEPRADVGPVRAASAMFAALQLSPSTLAASTVLHVALLIALGPLSIAGSRAEAPAAVSAASVGPPRLIYFAPRPPAAGPLLARQPRQTAVGVTVNRGGFRLTEPDSAARSVVDSSGLRGDSGTRFERGAEERELGAALEMEFRLGGDPLRVEVGDQIRLRELARLLTMRPLARLRVTGMGPSRRDSAFGARAGMREAEAFARELIALGIDRERIDLDASEARGCPPSEPLCGSNRSGVKTSLASGAREPRRP